MKTQSVGCKPSTSTFSELFLYLEYFLVRCPWCIYMTTKAVYVCHGETKVEYKEGKDRTSSTLYNRSSIISKE